MATLTNGVGNIRVKEEPESIRLWKVNNIFTFIHHAIFLSTYSFMFLYIFLSIYLSIYLHIYLDRAAGEAEG